MEYSNRPDRKPETNYSDLLYEVELLRRENTELSASRQKAYDYIRDKVNQLLIVIGTKTLKPEELDDNSLVEFDPIGIVAEAFVNILENLKETNRSLHFAHDEVQAIFDAVGSALLVLDPAKNIVAFNQKTRDLLVGNDANVHGCKCNAIICRETVAGMPCIFEMVMESKREQQLQDRELHGHSFKVVGRPIYDENNEITHVVISYADVTARKKAEKSLELALAETQEANSKIQGILRSVSDGLLITDSQDQIVLMNSQAESLLGVCLLDEMVRPALEFLPSESLCDLLRNARKGERFIKQDIVLKDKNNDENIYQARVTVIRSPAGEYKGSITFLHDVNEQRELERSKSEFVSTAAHELRTPLATIIGYTDLLLHQDERSDDSLQEYLLLIQKKAERLAEIVSDLLDISRIESGEALKMITKPLPIKELCEDVLTAYRDLDNEHMLTLDVPSGDVYVLADRYALSQILENLISNAVKYSPNGGNVRLSARVKDGQCQITIADDGIGMKPDQVEKIFDKFYRADASNTAVSGTGLGMTIVKYLVEAQQGEVRVESKYGRGTSVYLSFPLAAPPVKALH